MRIPTYIFDAGSIARDLIGLDDSRCLAFGIFLFERALPAFFQFQIDTNYAGGGELRAALAQCWYVLEHGSLPNKSFITAETCEGVMPDSEDHLSPYTSSAIDAVNIACNLLSYIEKRDLHFILDAAESRRDTLDLFIQREVSKDEELETAIANHPLMQEELCFMYNDIAFLSGLNRNTTIFAAALKRVTELAYRELRLRSQVCACSAQGGRSTLE